MRNKILMSFLVLWYGVLGFAMDLDDSIAVENFVTNCVLSQTVSLKEFNEHYRSLIKDHNFNEKKLIAHCERNSRNTLTLGVYFLFNKLDPEDIGYQNLVWALWRVSDEKVEVEQKYTKGIFDSKKVKEFFEKCVYSNEVTQEQFRKEFNQIKYEPLEIFVAYRDKYSTTIFKHNLSKLNLPTWGELWLFAECFPNELSIRRIIERRQVVESRRN